MDEAKRQAEVILETAKAISEAPFEKHAELMVHGAKEYGAEFEANGFEEAVVDEVARIRVRRSRAKRKAEKAQQAAA